MSLFLVAALGAACVAFVVVLLIHVRRRSPTVASDSSDEETSGPLNVSVVVDHDEQASLLPKFADMLRSPWNSSAAAKEQPKVTRPVRKGGRSMSLTMPLPLRKKRKAAQVPTKKVHVAYFFPLLDETAEWWQAQQPTSTNSQPTETGESEASSGLIANMHEAIFDGSICQSFSSTRCNQSKEGMHRSGVSSGELLQSDVSLHLMSAPIEVGGN
ncbi:hypothetical protein PHMEG_0005709 [Phytophthora megakarya]|uniref:Uncharacterized protein n=1 Tax=Phytophthora megakarya TaxID=4795 RepID=A0A225WQS5_9STRA|nr:hypothetical protein PHMEG_0005709 [Phytophthora megakarya]